MGIFTAVFEQLESNPENKYTVGDIAFLKEFYKDRLPEEREKIKKFVRNGQLDIVHGGMVSNDEACPNYSDILRNFEAGHAFMMDEFGVKPRIGWQLDPFGHSAAHADLLAELGMDTVVFARVNKQEAKHRRME